MYEDEVNDLIQRSKLLKHKFLGVFAANNFPKILQPNSVIIVNASTPDIAGTHWLLLFVKNKNLIFTDPVGQTILFYNDVHRRLVFTQGDVQLCQVLENQPTQRRQSKLCELFCIYFADLIFSFRLIVNFTDNDLIRFALHMMMISHY